MAMVAVRRSGWLALASALLLLALAVPALAQSSYPVAPGTGAYPQQTPPGQPPQYPYQQPAPGQGAYPPPGGQPQQQYAASPIVGNWLARSQDTEVFAQFLPNGTFQRYLRTMNQPMEYSAGVYAVNSGILELRTQGSMENLRFNLRMPDMNTLVITDAQGNGVQLVRQAF